MSGHFVQNDTDEEIRKPTTRFKIGDVVRVKGEGVGVVKDTLKTSDTDGVLTIHAYVVELSGKIHLNDNVVYQTRF